MSFPLDRPVTKTQISVSALLTFEFQKGRGQLGAAKLKEQQETLSDIYNLFMTSKNETTNSPIHQFTNLK